MAMERGLNGLTGNMTQLTAQIKKLQAPPLVNKPPPYLPPSNNYVEKNNPNYPSSVIASSIDLDQDFLEEEPPQLTALDRAVSESLEASTEASTEPLFQESAGKKIDKDIEKDTDSDTEVEQAGLKSVQGDKDATPLFTTPEQKPVRRATTTILQKVRGSETYAEAANILIDLARGLGMENMARFVNSEGLVKKGQVGQFKTAIMSLQRQADAGRLKRGVDLKGGGK
tara:strand:- start:142 stop:822 length:681 start_codon:yes stop_codon:yes gene_type:complete